MQSVDELKFEWFSDKKIQWATERRFHSVFDDGFLSFWRRFRLWDFFFVSEILFLYPWWILPPRWYFFSSKWHFFLRFFPEVVSSLKWYFFLQNDTFVFRFCTFSNDGRPSKRSFYILDDAIFFVPKKPRNFKLKTKIRDFLHKTQFGSHGYLMS